MCNCKKKYQAQPEPQAINPLPESLEQGLTLLNEDPAENNESAGENTNKSK